MFKKIQTPLFHGNKRVILSVFCVILLALSAALILLARERIARNQFLAIQAVDPEAASREIERNASSGNPSLVVSENTNEYPSGDANKNQAISRSPAYFLTLEEATSGDLALINRALSLRDDVVTSKKIAFHAIRQDDLDTDSVTSRIIRDGTIQGEDIDPDTTLNIKNLNLSNDLSVNGTISGSFVPTENVDMSTHILTNIGNVGTDFTNTGGLILADALAVESGGATITGDLSISSATGSDPPPLSFSSQSNTFTVAGLSETGAWRIITVGNTLYASAGESIYRCDTSTLNCNTDGDWTLSFSGSGTVSTLFFDSVDGVLYAGSGYFTPGGNISRCDTITGCDEQSDWTTSFVSGKFVIGEITLDSTHRVLYVGTGNNVNGSAVIYRCNLETSCDDQNDWIQSFAPSDSGVWNILSMTFDPVQSVLYAGTSVWASIVYRCDTTTECDEQSDWTLSSTSFASPSNMETQGLYYADGAIYAGMYYAGLARCDTSTGCDQSSDWHIISTNFGTIRSFYHHDSFLYAARNYGNGSVYRCALSSGCESEDDWSVYFKPNNIGNVASLTQLNNILYVTGDGGVYRKDLTVLPTNLAYARIRTVIADPSPGSEDGLLYFDTITDGVLGTGAVLKGGSFGIGTTSPSASFHDYLSSAAVTTSQTTALIQNLATNTTTDGINKYGLTITSTGSFTGSTDTATNNYGLYLNTPTGADNNFALYAVGGSSYFGGNIGLGTIFTTGSPADKFTLSGGNATIYNTALLGTEKASNTGFSTIPDTAWTWGGNWLHDTTGLEADHIPGNTSALEQNASSVSGEIYQVVFTIKNRTAGSITPQIGGVNGTIVSSNTTSTQQIRVTGSGNLKFVPTIDFDGSIDTISVKLILGGNLNLSGIVTGGGNTGIKVLASGNVGIGTTTPTNILSIGGQSARTIWTERNTTANTAGNNLTFSVGGATIGATNKNGGDLYLASGTATGTGSSNIYFQTATVGTTGTTDNAPSTKMTILGNGNVGIGTTSPSARLQSTISNAAVTTSQTTALIQNLATNTTTDGINKYGLTITSTGSFIGSSGTTTNNYGLYLNTTSGGDNNYQIYDQSGASLTTSGTWTNAPSYRKYKGSYTETGSYLDKLMSLDIYEWQYKDETIDGQNRYTDDKDRHASPFLDDFYNTFRLGTPNGYNIQDLAGVALASVKELNTRFISNAEATDIALSSVTLKTDTSVTTLATLQSSIDEELKKIQDTFSSIEANNTETNKILSDHEARLLSLEMKQKSTDERLLTLETTNQALLDFYTNLNLNNIPVVLNGTLDLGEVVVTVKSLDAKEAVSAKSLEAGSVKTDAITVNNTDLDRKTLGTATIREGETSVTVETKAVTEGSQIFVTPKDTPVSFAVSKNIGEDFSINISEPAEAEIQFSWWILEETLVSRTPDLDPESAPDLETDPES